MIDACIIEYQRLSGVAEIGERQKDLISQALKGVFEGVLFVEKSSGPLPIVTVICQACSGAKEEELVEGSIQTQGEDLFFQTKSALSHPVSWKVKVKKSSPFYYISLNSNIEKNAVISGREFEIKPCFRGQPLSSSHCPSSYVFKSHQEAQINIKALVGKKTKKDILVGQAVEPSSFMETFSVFANDNVKFKYVVSGIVIETQGTAKRAGKKDDVIDIEITSFQKNKVILKGKVVGPGEVVYAAH